MASGLGGGKDTSPEAPFGAGRPDGPSGRAPACAGWDAPPRQGRYGVATRPYPNRATARATAAATSATGASPDTTATRCPSRPSLAMERR